MKLMVICGTRPEVIKLAPVIEAARQMADRIQLRVCATGQHREMLGQALASFGIVPDVALDLMTPNQSLAELTARLVSSLDRVIAQEAPDWVLVQGDTTSAFAAALVAFYRGIHVGHVEAGLRTHDLANPFPEEANRQLIARIAGANFAPTQRAAATLTAEGIAQERIFVTGNTIVDAVAAITRRWSDTEEPALLENLIERDQPLVLVTCHRRESFGDGLRSICAALRRLCAEYPQLTWVFPVHLNPHVRSAVFGELKGLANLRLVDPVDYETSLRLIRASTLVLTDSGGIQEEAPSFGVPVVVMRAHTERREGVDAGFATLAGTATGDVIAAARAWLDRPDLRAALRQRPNPYGDGHAGKRIVARLLGEPVEAFHG